MTNGGKDIKFGHDKRPITRLESNEQDLFNIANGERLTDEFGTPLVTEVDTFFLKDATAERSTSVVFPKDKTSAYQREDHVTVGILTATYNTDLDLTISNTNVSRVGASAVGVGSTALLANGSVVTIENFPFLTVQAALDTGKGERGKLYNVQGSFSNVKVGDFVSGAGIPDGTKVDALGGNTFAINNPAVTGVGGTFVGEIEFKRYTTNTKVANQTWKIQENFKTTSEVSTSLLGVNRAETQLSLFSNVSSYGIDSDSFELETLNGGSSFSSWETRTNKIYGPKYTARQSEEVNESAIRLEAFPVPYSFPFGPNFARLGLYDVDQFQAYLSFIELGNQLYDYYSTGAGASMGYPSDWKDRFLDRSKVYVTGGDVVYGEGIKDSFALIDTWTDTWRDIKDSLLTDPVERVTFNFPRVNTVLGNTTFDSTTTRPGYSDSQLRYSALQSRRVFRYQPGRISGFTFGVRSSVEPKTGVIIEWGITNPTDQYVFRIDAGQLSIVRRSTVALEQDVLDRNGLKQDDQVRLTSGNPYDDEQYWTINIPRDKFNGDPLNGNGPSGWNIKPDQVTMYKIEFGWYGAIGARFYAYIPSGNGEARWVTIHTLVIENSLGVPCLQDSYFRLRYSLNVSNTGEIREPQFIYKYGSSYYIDGGDEGTSQIFTASTLQKTILPTSSRSLIGITPKKEITSSSGINIPNKKLIIPTVANFTSDSLAKIEVVTCKACPGFGHVYTPGIATTESGREIEMEFTDGQNVAARNDSYFYESDIGAKVIAPTIFNAYVAAVSGPVGTAGSFLSATIRGYGGLTGYPSYSTGRDVAGNEVRHAVTGITTIVATNAAYPDTVRLSNYDVMVSSTYKITGSKVEVNFLNPGNTDLGHFADVLVGLTDATPITSLPSSLTGFNVSGVTTSMLQNKNILFGEWTHSHASMDENGIEGNEVYYDSPSKMGIDRRIPNVKGAAPGQCSKITFEILPPNKISRITELNYRPNDNTQTVDGNLYLNLEGLFPANVDYDGGQLAIEVNGEPQVTNAFFVGSPVQYLSGGQTFSYIQISQSTGQTGEFSIFIRPVKATGKDIASGVGQTKQKLYNFIPYPLFLVFKLKDNAALNNISVKEIIGETQKTVAPLLFTSGVAEITNAPLDGVPQALITGEPPTNFKSISRLSSAGVDTQNEQKLRPGVTRDTFFVGANETTQVDMSKVFGQDRNVITPDNNNLEATFWVAKKIDSGASGTMEASINYKEQ